MERCGYVLARYPLLSLEWPKPHRRESTGEGCSNRLIASCHRSQGGWGDSGVDIALERHLRSYTHIAQFPRRGVYPSPLEQRLDLRFDQTAPVPILVTHRLRGYWCVLAHHDQIGHEHTCLGLS